MINFQSANAKDTGDRGILENHFHGMLGVWEVILCLIWL